MNLTEAQFRSIRDALGDVDWIDRVILFGSRARGDASADSDIDLLVITVPELPKRGQLRREFDLRNALPRIGVGYDLILLTESEFDFWSGAVNHVAAYAKRDGVIIFERSASQSSSTSFVDVAGR